jgi:hypothetical protein
MFDRPTLDADDDEDHEDEDDDDCGPVPAEPPLTHEGMPIHGWHGGDPVPDLDRIPKERWREVLAPLRHATRQWAKAATQSDVVAAGILVGELSQEDGAARHRAVSAPPPGMPAGAALARGPGHQVNFRIGHDEFERLAEAARLFAMRPTTLARVLTMRGVERALYEHRQRP